MTETAGRGRPRSEQARRAVLDAALRLCMREGYPNLTMKGIADEAGVGRQTVYRWWPAKSDVLIEALRDLADREAGRLGPDSGSARHDVRQLLELTFGFNQGITGRAVVGLMAEAQQDEQLSERLQSIVIGPRRAALRRILERGVERGELTERISLDLTVDLIFGTMWYRLLSRHAPIDRALARELSEVVGRLLGYPDLEA